MIQQAAAALSSVFTNKFVVKAIKPTLKLAKANITGAMSFAFNDFDRKVWVEITISQPTSSEQQDVTLVVTSPDGLTSYNVSSLYFAAGSVLIPAPNARPEWVGYTIVGNGIPSGTTVTEYNPVKPVSSGAIALAQTGATLSLVQKTQLKINMAALGIPWVENENYTFEFSADFTVGTEPDKNFSSPAVDIAYTANPPLAIASTLPTANDTGTEVNDYVIINFNRTVVPYIGQNFYFYETNGATSTLLKTFAVTTDIISRNKITLDVRGLMKESTSYYVLSDEEIVKDSDNFVFNGITSSSTFAFTSAVPVDFRGFISIQTTFGSTLANVYRLRSTATSTMSSLFTSSPIASKRAKGAASLSSLFTYTKSIIGNRKKYTASISSMATMVTSALNIQFGSADLLSAVTASIDALKIKEAYPAPSFVTATSTASGDRLRRITKDLQASFAMTCNGDETQIVMMTSIPDMNTNASYIAGPSKNLTSIFTTTPSGFISNVPVEYDYLSSTYGGNFGAASGVIAGYNNVNDGNIYPYTVTAFSDTHLYVGAPEKTTSFNSLKNGAVYAFKLDDGTLDFILEPNKGTGNANNYFGQNIAANSSYVVVPGSKDVAVYDTGGNFLRFLSPPVGRTTQLTYNHITMNDTTVFLSSDPTDNSASFSGSQYVRAFDLATGAFLWVQAIADSPYSSNWGYVTGSDNENVYVAGSGNSTVNGKIYVLNAATGALKTTISFNDTSFTAGKFIVNTISSNGTYVAFGIIPKIRAVGYPYTGYIQVHNVSDLSHTWNVYEPSDSVGTGTQFSNQVHLTDSVLITAWNQQAVYTNGGGMRIYDLQSRTLIHTYDKPDGSYYQWPWQLSVNGSYIAGLYGNNSYNGNVLVFKY